MDAPDAPKDPEPNLHEFIRGLAGSEDLANCWTLALSEVGVNEFVDLDSFFDESEHASKVEVVHPMFFMILRKTWELNKSVSQPFSLLKPRFEKEGITCLQMLEETIAHPKWKLVSSPSSSVSRWEREFDEDVSISRRCLIEEKSKGVVCNVSFDKVFAHLWMGVFPGQTSLQEFCLVSWQGEDGTMYDLRTQRISPSRSPFDARQTLLLRVFRKVSDTQYRIAVWSFPLDEDGNINETLRQTVKKVVAECWNDKSFEHAYVACGSGYTITKVDEDTTLVTRVWRVDPRGSLSVASGNPRSTRFFFYTCQWLPCDIWSLQRTPAEQYNNSSKLYATVAAAGAIGAIGAPIAFMSIIAALGFGAEGIVAGSVAAGMMGPAVASGSTFATLQSVGVVGLAGGPLVALMVASGLLVAGAAFGSYKLVEHVRNKNDQTKRQELIQSYNIHHCNICQDEKYVIHKKTQN